MPYLTQYVQIKNIKWIRVTEFALFQKTESLKWAYFTLPVRFNRG